MRGGKRGCFTGEKDLELYIVFPSFSCNSKGEV